MKSVLITGANSFLGNNVKSYLEKKGSYKVDILDMLNENWRSNSFSNYDVVLNVCAIVHRPKEKNIELYYKVNRDLAYELAKKSKREGVKQFIQMSTNGVFGIEAGIMNSTFGFHPNSPYEKSKYEADILISNLKDKDFKICIIRTALIYGKGCKGNYPRLERFAIHYHWFPKINNKKDFIYIGNLCDFIMFSIENELSEVCYPRDEKQISTYQLVKLISINNKKHFYSCHILVPFIYLFRKHIHLLRIIFCDNYCTEKCSTIPYLPPYTLLDAMKEMYE